ncbi:hypothetical protein WJX82_010799 [Trebouxia sp. C0006]
MHYSQQKWIRSGPRKLANVYAGHSHLPHNRRDLARSRSYKRLWHASQGPRNRSGGPSRRTATLCYSVTAAGSSGGREGAGATTQELDRRRFLLRYVQAIQPEVMEDFVQHAPAHVVDAMSQTIRNYLGTLLPQFFQVSISAKGEDLAQLMYTMMMSGYMFRNAHYRLELRDSMLPSGHQSFDEYDLPPALPIMGMLDHSQDGKYAPGSQKTRVSGEVLRWHHENGTESVPASEYIEKLESENRILKQQVSTQLYVHAAGNELLNFLKGLEADQVKSLTLVSEDGVEAMNTFIHRLLGTDDLSSEDMEHPTQASQVELARLMFWLMVVGYNLRTLEVRFDMEQTMLLPPGV